MKISIIGAGNVGSMLAERVLAGSLADAVLVDIAEGLAKAKAFDISDGSPILGYEKRVLGTSDYKEIKGSEIVVVTAGFARKPGMSREDLTRKNKEVVLEVVKNVKNFSPDAILVMVTNPLDVMTYLAYEEMKTKRQKIIGMAGNLDSARFKMLISEELGIPAAKIETFVLGSHGDTMVPLVSKTLVNGKPLIEVLSKKEIKSLVERTKKRGGEIVGLLKSGSAFFSPSAACFEILKAIINDEKKMITCSLIMDGEYGFKGCALGVPAKIGKSGVEEILKWELTDEELSALKESARLLRPTSSASQ